MILISKYATPNEEPQSHFTKSIWKENFPANSGNSITAFVTDTSCLGCSINPLLMHACMLDVCSCSDVKCITDHTA